VTVVRLFDNDSSSIIIIIIIKIGSQRITAIFQNHTTLTVTIGTLDRKLCDRSHSATAGDSFPSDEAFSGPISWQMKHAAYEDRITEEMKSWRGGVSTG